MVVVLLFQRFSTEDGSLTIEVADTGIGIAPENVAKDLRSLLYNQGRWSGTGLGLACPYGIVQEHAGQSVWKVHRRGTSFRITLPTTRARVLLQAVGD